MRDGRPAILGGEPVRREPFPPRRTMGEEEKRAVAEVMDSDVLSAFIGGAGPFFGGGQKVRAFEETWARKYRFRHAISVNSWTSGLIVAVGACGIGPGDEVICSPYSMSASATCALFYGGIPVFADLDPRTCNLAPASIEARITPRTRAIIVVHLFGHAADMDPILDIARRHSLKVIEDAAQAPGALYHGRPVGAIGDIGGFSLNFHKHIHTGEGGMIVTNDDDLALRCRLIRNHGENAVEDLDLPDLTNVIGQNNRLTEIQAAIGLVQIERLEGYLGHRQRLADYLHTQIEQLPGLATHRPPADHRHSYYAFPIYYDAERAGLSRSQFVRAVAAELPGGGGPESVPLTEAYVRPLYLARIYQERRGLVGAFPWSCNPEVRYEYPRGLCPVAERMYDREMLLTALVREPVSVKDIDDFVRAMSKVLHHAPEISARQDPSAGVSPFTPLAAANQSDAR